MPTAQRAEVALHTVALLRGLRQEEVAGVLQVGPLVEVTLKRTAQKTHVVLVQLRLVLFLDEPTPSRAQSQAELELCRGAKEEGEANQSCLWTME